MDARHFEALSRRVGTAATRRDAVKALAASLGAAALAQLQPGRGVAREPVDIETVVPNSLPIVHCRVTLQKCHDDRQCCSGICKKTVPVGLPNPLPDIDLEGVCDCRKSGDVCYKLLEGVFCCSGRCTNDGKCA